MRMVFQSVQSRNWRVLDCSIRVASAETTQGCADDGGHKVRHLLVCAAAALVVLSGCGGSDGDDRTTAPEKEKPKVVAIDYVSEDGDTVRAKSVLLRGKVSEPGATVDIDSKEVTADTDGSFRIRVRLPDIGENQIYVDARKPGFESDSETIYVTRALSAAERAARAERRRERREAELAELRASAEQLDPELLQKDPDRYAGQKVVMSGEIFQIQEGGDNFFLMDTVCSTEYDITICDGPTVYVTYPFGTDKTEDDLVTVYGEVMGGYEYDTQIGGSNYVGWIEARIIE
jgi:hypothetical protein